MTVFFSKRTYTNWGWARRPALLIEREGPCLVFQFWRLRIVVHRAARRQ